MVQFMLTTSILLNVQTNLARKRFKMIKRYINKPIEIEAVQYDGKNIKPFWIAGTTEKRIDSYEFAKIAVQQIIDCCTIKNKKTKLQVYDKDKKEMRNVNFHDFAILARATTEMPDIEYALQKAGIPFLHYKDKNLFTGMAMAFRSCLKQYILPISKNACHDEWISLICTYKSKIYFLEEKLVKYRIHEKVRTILKYFFNITVFIF